jgi:Uma2 family endonuclease
MNTLTTERLLTGDDLLELQAQTGKQFELVKGLPVEVMPAGGKHGYIAATILGEIFNFVRTRKLGFVFAAETGVYLERNPDTVRGADVTFISKAKLGDTSEIPERGFLDVVPDLVVEVRSPNDRDGEVDEKIREYQAAGVPMIWVIHPQKKEADVYQQGKPKQTLSETDALDGGDVLVGFILPLKDIF